MKTAIVLAGGFGTRLRSVVHDIPKPMAAVQGRPFLEWLLQYYRARGITRFILAVGYLAHTIQNHFGSAWQGCAIDYSVEQTPLGTGGAILLASQLLDPREHHCLAMNGDTFFAIDPAQLLAFHLAKNAALSLAAFESNDTQRFMGIQTNAHDQVLQFNIKSQTGSCLVNGGAYVINQTLLRSLTQTPIAAQSWENETLPGLLNQGFGLFATPMTGAFIDIGIPSDYELAQSFDFQIPPQSFI